jgi:predicted AlkP superfamily pyrophosphatase or phosphodiesterase
LRITIIGVDGLDYDIVEAMELKNLQQIINGKLSIPIECFREVEKGVYSPWTPLCWMSIITGQIPPEKFRQEKKRVYSNEIIDWTRRHFGKHFGLIRGKRNFLMKSGVKLSKYKMVETPYIGSMKTIFDLGEKVIDYNIPSYSEGYTLRPFGKEAEGLEHLRLFDQEDRLVKRYIKSVISRKKDYDLFMSYLRAIDHYGHQKFLTKDYFNRYKLMDFFIHEIQKKIDGLLLICSDHGFQKLEGTRTGGRHSDHAFYSLNMETDGKMESLLDIYPLVEKMLKI